MHPTSGLDVLGIIDVFGGRLAIRDGLDEHKIRPITLKGIDKWVERQTIPVQRLIELKELANKKGLSLSIDKFTI